jgi:hypothetical protein
MIDKPFLRAGHIPTLVASFFIALGLVLGVAGASFATTLPLASRWYPPEYQGIALGIAARETPARYGSRWRAEAHGASPMRALYFERDLR